MKELGIWNQNVISELNFMPQIMGIGSEEELFLIEKLVINIVLNLLDIFPGHDFFDGL